MAVFSLSLKRDEPPDAQESDALSVSSDLLNLLLSEDLCSATGSALSGSGASATSDSLGSSSPGCNASRSGAGMLSLGAWVCVDAWVWDIPGGFSSSLFSAGCIMQTCNQPQTCTEQDHSNDWNHDDLVAHTVLWSERSLAFSL